MTTPGGVFRLTRQGDTAMTRYFRNFRWFFSFAAMVVAMLAGTARPADARWTDGPIWDLKVIYGDDAGISCGDGWDRINADLNEGAGGKYVYLCASYTKGEHLKPVAGLYVCNLFCPPGYETVRAEPLTFPGYLNAG